MHDLSEGNPTCAVTSSDGHKALWLWAAASQNPSTCTYIDFVSEEMCTLIIAAQKELRHAFRPGSLAMKLVMPRLLIRCTDSVFPSPRLQIPLPPTFCVLGISARWDSRSGCADC